MSVTIYQIPADKWCPGKPRPKNLERFQVVATGEPDEALQKLVSEVNAQHIDDVNCYLYIDVDKTPQLGNIVKLNLKNTVDSLAVEFTFREHERRREVVELSEILIETGGKIEVAEKYAETYEKWCKYFRDVLKENFV
jgi:hypothetical protein